MSPLRRLVITLTVLCGVFVVGTLGYLVIEQERCPSVFDAAYMTMTTMTTVGFREVWELSRPGQVWTLCIVAIGVTTYYVAASSLVSLFVGGDLLHLRERKKMQRTIEHMRGHVILCGYGRMGSFVAAELTTLKLPIVVIEKSRDLEANLTRSGLPFVIGDATDEEVLLEAGLDRAKTLVVALPTDSENVFITLTARSLRSDLTIIVRAELPATERKVLRAGASRVICPQIIGARRIRDIITRPNVVDFVDVANKGVDLEMDEYVIQPQSPLRGMKLRDSLLRQQGGAIVVAIKSAAG